MRLKPEHEQLRERRFVAERGDAKHRDGRGRRQFLRLGPGVGLPRVPSDLERERHRQHQPHRVIRIVCEVSTASEVTKSATRMAAASASSSVTYCTIV